MKKMIMIMNMKNKDFECNKKIDAYSMGKIFYELCHLLEPKKLRKKSEVNYSKEMLNLIIEMLEKDYNKRQISEYFLSKIRKEFSKNYNRKPSIDAIVKCLYTFEDITNYYKSLKGNEIENKPTTKTFINCLNTFNDQDMKLCLDSKIYFYEMISSLNSRFVKTKELNPELILLYIIQQLNIEDNNINKNIENNYLIKVDKEFIETNEIKMKINFLDKFYNIFNSYLSKKIMGLMKNIYKCEKCKMETYSFNAFFYFSIDLENLISNKINLDIEDYIKYKNNTMKKVEKHCWNCINQTEQEKNEKYDTFPDDLIFIIQRGKNSSKIPFKLKQNIDLNNLIGINGKKYKLVGFINTNHELGDYSSFIKSKSPDSNEWFRCQGDKVEKFERKEHEDMFEDPNGKLIMAFYEANGN